MFIYKINFVNLLCIKLDNQSDILMELYTKAKQIYIDKNNIYG